MLTSLATSATGLRHAGARLQAVAHDTANLNTQETAVLRAHGREAGAGRGVATAVDGHLERRSPAGPAPAATDAVALEAESATAAHGARANATAVRAADAMLGTLLDAVG